MRIITLCCFILFINLSKTDAQVTFEIQDVSTCENTVSIPVVVLEDINLNSISFTLVWDEGMDTNLSYSGFTDMIGSGSFSLGPNVSNPSAPNDLGTLTYGWFTNAAGHSFTAGDQLFVLELNIENPNAAYSISFEESPVAIIATTSNLFEQIEVNTNSGQIRSGVDITCPPPINETVAPGTSYTADASQLMPTILNDCSDGIITYTISGDTPDESGPYEGQVLTFSSGTSQVLYSITDGTNPPATCILDVTITETGATGITFEIAEITSDCNENIAVPVTVLQDQVTSSIDFSIFWEDPEMNFTFTGMDVNTDIALDKPSSP